MAVCSADPGDTVLVDRLVSDAAFERVVNHRTGPATSLVTAVAPYTRLSSNPVAQVRLVLDALIARVGASALGVFAGTGAGADVLEDEFGMDRASEIQAMAQALNLVTPDARTVFEIGGETSRFIRLERQASGLGVVAYHTNGDCAAGTGSFLDQQAGRLRFGIEDVGAVALGATRAAQIAGRCSVFAKSDMIHAQQIGFSPAEILRGLCGAVARNYRGTIVKGRPVVPEVVFLGGSAANAALVRALESAVGLEPETLRVPDHHASFLAIGAALVAHERAQSGDGHLRTLRLNHSFPTRKPFPRSPALSMDGVLLLRDRMQVVPLKDGAGPVDVYLGIDIGSVSTNLVLINEAGEVLKEIYLRTEGRPIEAVNRGLHEIRDEFGNRVVVRGMGTTGSGRDLIAELVGADTVKDEITAHKTGAAIIDRSLLGLGVDTVFEIGGQDAKYISLQDGVVVDFAMNEACAAGTGSFLEERARELGIKIEEQFARLALSSRHPIRLGERCTVFMEKDVNAYLRRGAEVQDLVAGLAYSVATNYINRVIRGRRIGDVIFFQGGTAYNDAVSAALSQILQKRIIVPPFNGVMGALGMAHIAMQKMRNSGARTSFRGVALEEVSYQTMEFACHGCSNTCRMQRFTVEGEHTYWGDKCAVKYRKTSRVDREPVIEDLVAFRHEQLLKGYRPDDGRGPVVGLPLAMSTYDWAPFWLAALGDLGLKVLLSEPTSNQIIALGAESTVSEPCFPVLVALGHVRWLLNHQADVILVPNNISAPGNPDRRPSFFCPWTQTLPFVTRAAPFIYEQRHRILAPTLWFNHGERPVVKALRAALASVRLEFSDREVRRAVRRGFEELTVFRENIRAAGTRAVAEIERTGEQGVVLLGRAYNVHDKGVNLDVATKLRRYYGANVLGFDFLDAPPESLARYEDATYWSSGTRLLAAAAFTKDRPNLHIIYITNFKCGPDSYLKHYVRDACGRPFLALQYDGHNNDAGMLTRCEAYLESKGALH